MKKLIAVKDGEWFEVKNNRGHLLGCCDCGPVHRLNFRVIRDGQKNRIQIQAFRAPRKTLAQRSKK